MSTRATL